MNFKNVQGRKSLLKFFATVVFSALMFPVLLLASGESAEMKSSLQPQGVLYVLDNYKLRRFDFETKETDFLFQDLFQRPLQLHHLGYLKTVNGLVFFDKGNLSKEGNFLLANPLTEKTEVLFHSKRIFELQGGAYSPNGKWFSFLNADSLARQGSELWIQNFSSGEEVKLEDKVLGAPLWMTDRFLLYVDSSAELVQIDIETKEKRAWGFKDIYPKALSLDGSQILAIDKDNSKIYLLVVTSKSLKLVKAFSKRQLYGSIVWSPDGRSFIYNRTDARDHFLLPYLWGETPWRLYWHNIETGDEKRISNNPWWKDPSADLWLYSGAVWLAEDLFK